MDPAEIMMQKYLLQHKPIMEATERGDSEVQRFYSGSTVLVTGGTGFLGKLLLEKLIRACNINKIYMLVRPKKGKEMGERFTAFQKDVVFDTLREKQPNFGDKIVPVQGDIAELRLGLSDQDWTMLTEQVDVVFHLAATTRFDAALGQAALINIRGTREIVTLAKQCKNIRSFVYVSTAYSQATRSRIKSDVLEKFYPSPISSEAMISMVETMDGNKLKAITDKLIDGWPNTYTFTKAIAEDLIRTNVGNLPVCVIRPPIGAYAEPAPGWIDPSCVFGATGWFLTLILGVIHVVLSNDILASLTPADYVINATIASGYQTYSRHKVGDKELKVYNITGEPYDFGTGKFFLRSDRCRSLVSPKSVWYSDVLETANPHVYWLLTWIFHYIPAYIIDAIIFLFGLKLPEGIPSVITVYTKIYNTTMTLSFFFLNDWTFRSENTVEMYKRMSTTDKALFNFDMRHMDWNDYMIALGLGIRKYIVKDELKNTAHGVKMQFWFKIATFIILPLYAYLMFRVLFFFYSSVLYIM